MKATEETVLADLEKPLATPFPLAHKRHYVRRLEFFDEFWIDTTHDIPLYYIVDRDDQRVKVRIGVSFEVTRNRRIKKNALGRLFYPIVVQEGFTGNGFSINAPFVLNTLRSGLAPQNELNALLQRQAATFIANLFRNILLHRFGVSAYMLLKETSVSNAETFLDALYESIREQRCVLNNKYVKGSEIDHEDMFCADDQYLPCKIVERNGVEYYYAAKDLHGFIGNNRCVTCEIGDVDLLGLLVSKLDAKHFTIHDVVSLKVNDYVQKKPPTGWHFKSKDAYTSEMVREERQLKYADAINEHFKELTDKEKIDLSNSYSWLNESGHLRPLRGKNHLFQWKGAVPELPGFHTDDLIHNCISNHPSMKKLHVVPYDLNKAILSATIPKLERGEFDEAKKSKLLEFLVDNASKLSRKVIRALKVYPIFLDSKERFVEFNRLVRTSKAEAKVFGDAISIPCKKLLKSKIFLKRFRIRRKINDDDILRKTEQLFQTRHAINKNDVLVFEAYLNKRKIESNLANRLKEVFMIVCSDNITANPQSKTIYYDSKKMRSLLGNEVLYAKGKFKGLFRKLGVRFKPLSGDMINFITKLRETGVPLPYRSLLYIELTKALVRDGIDPREHRTDEIISKGGRYNRPKDVFLDKAFRNVLLDSKVYLSAKGKLREALIELGCKVQPTDEDYVDFLKWASTQLLDCASENFRKKYISLIHYAYSKLSSPNGIRFEDKVILTHDDQMVSRRDVAEQRVYIDDNPQLSGKVKSDRIPIWFVNCGVEGYDFVEALGVPKLSDSVVLTEKIVEGPQPANNTIKSILLRLKSPDVINAIQSVVQQNDEWRKDLSSENWTKSLADLQSVKLAKLIKKTFNIANYKFSINAGCCLDGQTVYFLNTLKPYEMKDVFAIEISNMVLKTKHHRASLADALYRFLEGDITHYLSSRGYVFQESLKKPERILGSTFPERTKERKIPPSPQLMTPEVEQRVEPEPELDSKEEEKEIRIEILSPDSIETPPSTGWRGKGPRLAERFRTADISYGWIIRMEESDDPQCSALDKSDEDLGYDIEVRKEGEITKMIEVKSSRESHFPVQIVITPNEWRKAKDGTDQYWLYVVRDVCKENKDVEIEEIKNRVKKFHDPYKLFKNTASFEKRVVTRSEKRVIIRLDIVSLT